MVGVRGGARRIVVGGGIAGAFAAYFLANAGADVVLVERGPIGGEASGNNPGGLTPRWGAGIPGPLSALAMQAFRLHLDCGFPTAPKTTINLAFDDDDITGLTRLAQDYDGGAEFSTRWLEPHELRGIEPRLHPEVLAGLQADGDRRIDAPAYTRTVARAAADLGAVTIEDEVLGLRTLGDRVTGVVLQSETLACDGVVLATGAWASEPAAWLDVTIPIEPLKGELLVVDATGGPVAADFVWREVAVFKSDGAHTLLGNTIERAGFDREPSESARCSILEGVGQAFPGLAGSTVVNRRAGLRPVTPDGMPIVGSPGRWSNACIAMGGGRKGMLFGAALGRAAADLLTAGDTDLAIAPCAPDRFASTPSMPA